MTTLQTNPKGAVEEKQTSAPKVAVPELHLSSSPHFRAGVTVPIIMMVVILAMIPAFAASVIFYGWRAIILTAASVGSAVGTEWLINRFLKRPQTIGDFSAVITGILVAFNVPPMLPIWMVVIGSAFAIGVAKMVFGGLGANFINPALAGRAFLMANFPAAMTSFSAPFFGNMSGIDGITAATPLEAIKTAFAEGTYQTTQYADALKELFLGNVGGSIGETSAVALLLGGIFLMAIRVVDYRIPLSYIGTVFALFWIANGSGGHFTLSSLVTPTYHVLAGGLLLGAFFMATDMVTSPITPRGRILFGFGCGVLTFVIRKFGGYPEGVSYSILLMNLVVPLIDRYTRPTIYGEVVKRD
ncbi:MAG: RnfABCDGE type electron transport complex subunit D [Chitinispirillaceae bacterium]